ncbi:MAG: FHA domain-containing protein [Microbacteriaceae bacterium]
MLRLGFLALLWVFVFAVVYALRTDMFGHRARKLPPSEVPSPAQFPAAQAAPAPAPTPAPTPTPVAARTSSASEPTEALSFAGDGPASRLVITSGPREGMEIALGGEQVTIGRSSESGLVIRDDYTSTHHARLMLWNNEWMVQDLDSTTGTVLAGTRVTVPTRIPLNTPVKIGTTTFELRR